ncbi:MAG: M20 family metallopeptidase [Pyrinomonadaceae bacterium]
MKPLEILDYFQSREAEILDSIRELVDIESPSHNAEQSRLVADWIETKAQATGVDVSIERISVEDGEHVLVRAFPGQGKHIFLLGHTDTVHPIGTNEKNPTRIEGDKFYGCGIFDMKANVVLMLEALRFFATNGIKPPLPITILLSCDEEVGSFTGRALVEREAANAECCLVFEPSLNGKVKTGRKGTGMFKLHAHGVPAHAGLEPEKGANAILELSRQIQHIHKIARPDEGTTVNVTTIKGGTTTNVIPEYAECAIDVRFSKMSEAERVDAAFKTLTSFDERVSLELSGGINRPPMERTNAVVELYKRAHELGASFNYDIGETQVGGASDGNFVGALGVPVLDGLGIAGDGAHRRDEHILVSDIVTRATLVTCLMI